LQNPALISYAPWILAQRVSPKNLADAKQGSHPTYKALRNPSCAKSIVLIPEDVLKDRVLLPLPEL
jgi:hypothetical protein